MYGAVCTVLYYAALLKCLTRILMKKQSCEYPSIELKHAVQEQTQKQWRAWDGIYIYLYFLCLWPSPNKSVTCNTWQCWCVYRLTSRAKRNLFFIPHKHFSTHKSFSLIYVYVPSLCISLTYTHELLTIILPKLLSKLQDSSRHGLVFVIMENYQNLLGRSKIAVKVSSCRYDYHVETRPMTVCRYTDQQIDAIINLSQGW